MGHTEGSNHTANTCFTPFQPDFFKFMRYADVVKIINDLNIAALTGSLDKAQFYMYWYLEENGILSAFEALEQVKSGLEEEQLDDD